VAAAAPDIPDSRDCSLLRSRDLLTVISDVEFWNVDLQQVIDFDRIETGELKIEAQIHKLLELFADPFALPSRVNGDSIESESQGFNFRVSPVGHGDRGDFAAAEFAHRLPHCVAVDDDAFAVDDDRNDLPEMPNKVLKLLDLASVVNAHLRGVWLDLLKRDCVPF
jgi:hypothetical protein